MEQINCQQPRQSQGIGKQEKNVQNENILLRKT